MGSTQCCSTVQASTEPGSRGRRARLRQQEAEGPADDGDHGEDNHDHDDQRNGTSHRPRISEKGVYVGQTDEDGKRHGRGRFTYAVGEYYDGEWLHGKAHGEGTYWTRKVVYQGQWFDELKHGHGEEKHQDGARYVGGFRQGYRHGAGKMLFNDGSTYEGEFFQNNLQGYGSYVWSKSKHKYTGQWFESYLHGAGRYEWPDGSCYDGQYDMNSKKGEGSFTNKYGQIMDCMRWEKGRASGMTGFKSSHLNPKPAMWKSGTYHAWSLKSEENTPREVVAKSVIPAAKPAEAEN
eukprot:TRINITY_DN65390_c0_g1_i1.p1 TRINITY_DN65390_c0_g1~~TRINITY_DN65390_c0_g1_i1.p1  ORF type:complete len:292 (+),score=50.24 TRINITY_DN65390_c0_g1_i1:114-989(+)